MKFNFLKKKYGKELLIDLGQISKNEKFITNDTPFFISFYEIFFIIEGSGKFKLDNEIIPFQRGSILLLPPNKWRQWYKTNKPFDGFYLIFEEEFFSSFFNDTLYLYRFPFFYNTSTPSYIQFSENEFENILRKLKEIKEEIQNLKPDSEHLLRALLYYLLIKLNRSYPQDKSSNKNHYRENTILKFRKLLEENIKRKQRVSDYASLLKVSKSHLNKLMKVYFGKSCSVIIKEQLIIEIKRMLLFSDKSIAEISYELNFSEPSNFNRFFQNIMKITPNDYRLQNDNS